MVDKAFPSNFWQLSFGLSIKSTHEIEWSKWWLDEMEQRNSEKNQKFLVLNDKYFFLLTFNSRADIMARYTFNQVRCSFYIKYRFHGLLGYRKKKNIYIYIFIYIHIYMYIYLYIYIYYIYTYIYIYIYIKLNLLVNEILSFDSWRYSEFLAFRQSSGIFFPTNCHCYWIKLIKSWYSILI